MGLGSRDRFVSRAVDFNLPCLSRPFPAPLRPRHPAALREHMLSITHRHSTRLSTAPPASPTLSLYSTPTGPASPRPESSARPVVPCPIGCAANRATWAAISRLPTAFRLVAVSQESSRNTLNAICALRGIHGNGTIQGVVVSDRQ